MSQKQHHKDDDNQTENGMVRGLQNRHVQLIAIAGTIGTGLFLGAGRSLSLTGPSIILVYILTGIFMYLMICQKPADLVSFCCSRKNKNFIHSYIPSVLPSYC